MNKNKLASVAMAGLLIISLFLVAYPVQQAHAQALEWLDQFNAGGIEHVVDIFVHSTGVYAAGHAGFAEIPGPPGTTKKTDPGAASAFVRKYAFDGTVIKTIQFGTPGFEEDHLNAIAVDNTGVFVVGHTTGAFPDFSNAGDEDIFVRKYSHDLATLLWEDMFGKMGDDEPRDIAVTNTAIYVVGSISGEAFVRKYDLDGGFLGHISNPGAAFNGVAVDSSAVYVVGEIGDNALVQKYSLDLSDGLGGTSLGFGTGSVANGVAVDSSGVYVGGRTGSEDAFVRKYSPFLTQLWTDQFGTTEFDEVFDVSVHPSGVHVTGQLGGIPEPPTSPAGEAFVRTYTVNGTLGGIQELGDLSSTLSTSLNDHALAVFVDSTGVYVGGFTNSPDTGHGHEAICDAFVVNVDLPPIISDISDTPDPFCPDVEITSIIFTSNEAGTAGISFFQNSDGMSVSGIGGIPFIAGFNGQTWDGRHSDGNVLPDGTYTYTVSAEDFAGNGTLIDPAGTVTIDCTPPLLRLPIGLIQVVAGETVTYTATLTDSGGVPIILPLCSPSSGSIFPLGNNKVTCTATDSAGNSRSGTFAVRVLTPAEATQHTIDSLTGPPPDKVEDARANAQTALDELNKKPPDKQAAVGKMEGTVGDIEAAVNEGLDPEQGRQLMDLLAATARQLAKEALDQAIARGGDPTVIADAQQFLNDGDTLRASEAFKDAVNKYKDALAKAESVLF